MKTTLELPDSLYRRVKVTAAQRGQTITKFIASAIEAKLSSTEVSAQEKPWMAFAGAFESDKEELRKVLGRIEEDCGRINPRDWE